jgi:hypothetical protein
MFNPIDDVSLFGKKVAGFISGRGASTAAVAIAAPFVPAAQLPIVGLTVGLPIKAAVSSIEHYHREDAILDNYREEIAACFGIDMEQVTHDNLRILAFGNPKNNDPPQPFFEEILKKNDTSRWVDLGANIGAAALTMGFVFAAGAKVAGALSSLASGSGIALLVANPVVVGFIGLSLATAMVVHAIDYVITEVTKDAIGIKDKTSYELLEDVAKQKRAGREITQDKVMSVIASIDKGLKAEIISDYGAPYNALPLAERTKVLEKYGKNLHVEEYTAKINSGAVKVNELAFIAVGQSSGVPEREFVAVEKTASNETTMQPVAQMGIQNANNTNLTKFGENSNGFGKVNASTPATVSYAHISNDMPNSINFGEEPNLITAAKIDNAPQTKIKPEGIAQNNHAGLMQDPVMISRAIH